MARNNEFKPGFRLSAIDVVVLMFGIAASFYMHAIYPAISYIILCVVGHFFLFCNLVRMSRVSELAWSFAFIFLVGIHLSTGWLSSVALAIAVVVITSILVVLEMKKPSYHGVGWRFFNPELIVWFQKQHDK